MNVDSIGTPASYARTRLQRKISASVAGSQQSMRCGGQPPAELGAVGVILVWMDRRDGRYTIAQPRNAKPRPRIKTDVNCASRFTAALPASPSMRDARAAFG